MGKKIFCTVLLLISLTLISIAQKATIRGKIIDKETGETLIGATIVIEGTTKGTVTDFDGNYTLITEPGTYNLKISYISYETVVVTDVEAKSDEVTVVNGQLGASNVELDEVVVTAKVNKRKESVMMVMKRKSPKIYVHSLPLDRFYIHLEMSQTDINYNYRVEVDYSTLQKWLTSMLREGHDITISSYH